nr:GPI transamidase component PIG-S [Ipomoea batatas]
MENYQGERQDKILANHGKIYVHYIIPELIPTISITTLPTTPRLLLTSSASSSLLIIFSFNYKCGFHYCSKVPSVCVPLGQHYIHVGTAPGPDDFQAMKFGLDSLPHIYIVPPSAMDLGKDPIEEGFFPLKMESGKASRCCSIEEAEAGLRDKICEDQLESLLDSRSSRVYTVVVVNRDEEVRAVVGKYRHAWIVGKLSEQEAVEKVVEIFVEVFVNGGKEEGSIHGEFMPVGADGRVVLSFNLLNADPHDWIYDWDFQELDDMLLAPIVQALGPIADISVESQVLYYTPKSSFSGWDEKQGSYIFSIKDLPFFVNSNEWHLDTSTAAGGRSKVLHFVVYVPSEEECPLQLLLPNGKLSTTNGFISPMWGGVVVWNPPSCSKNSEMQSLRHKISSEELKKVFEVFMGQLRQLFGLNSDSLYVGATATSRLLTSEKGFTQWELDFISRQHTCFNLLQCGTTLGSLSRLVQSLPRMIIMDEIGKQVKFSLDAAKSSLSNASIGNYDASAVSSRQARSLAEDAFYHPSMMSVSYYSFEHCFAVYSPFFLPVALHVILAVLREWKRCKQENKKYLAWKAKVN